MAAKRGGRRAGGGRKPKPPGEKMKHRVGLAFTDAEFQELRAVTKGDPLATFIRKLVLRLLERRRRAGGD